MNKMDLDRPMQAEQKPTLMLAYDRLVTKARKLEEVQELSERLNRKFDRTDDRPVALNESLKEPRDVEQPNIIELFDEVAERLEYAINKIGKNTERVIQMIE
jgi:hypothetical protein